MNVALWTATVAALVTPQIACAETATARTRTAEPPQVTPRRETSPIGRLARREVTARAGRAVGGHAFVELPWADGDGHVEHVALIEPTGRHAFGVPSIAGDSLLLRFVGAAPAQFALRVVTAGGNEARPGRTGFGARYEHQLAVERSALSEQLGNLAAHGVALVVGDPYLREGTDVSVVFHVRNRTLLEGALAQYAAKARVRRPDAEWSTIRIEGREIRRLATPDREVNRHRLDLGDALILSNSPAGIRRFLAVERGAARALADAGDFRYLRTLHPYAADPAEGFLFIGDALVARVNGPRSKILQARRMAAAADLAALAHATLLYGWLEGRPPASAAEIISSGLLESDGLAHADGSRIELGPDGPHSARWGRLGALTPLDELETPKRVSTAELEAYQSFRDGYQRYWRQFIDPIGVRIRHEATHDGGHHTVFDGHMLPIIEGTEYDDLIELVGRAAVRTPGALPGIVWTAGIGQNAGVRRELDRMGASMGPGLAQFGWLGDWVAVGAVDSSALHDLAVISDSALGEGPRSMAELPDGGRRLAARLPFYGVVHVRQRLALAGILAAVRREITQIGAGVTWAPAAKHRGVETTVVGVGEVGGGLPAGLALHYAFASDAFVVALSRPVLERVIEQLVDGHGPKAGPTDDGAALQSTIAMWPATGTSWMRRTLLTILEPVARDATVAAGRAWEAFERGRPDSKPNAAIGWLGFAPEAPDGAAFALTDDGDVVHTRYGRLAAPTLPTTPWDETPLVRALGAMRSLQLSLGFEGEGPQRALRVRAEWRADRVAAPASR